MAKPKRDEEREDRIMMEIVVDAYDSEERITGWHGYLGDTLQFPFQAACIAKRSMSPLKVKDNVEVLDMADFDDCKGGNVRDRALARRFAGRSAVAIEAGSKD